MGEMNEAFIRAHLDPARAFIDAISRVPSGAPPEPVISHQRSPGGEPSAAGAETSLRCYLPRRLALLYTFMRRRPAEVMEQASAAGCAAQVYACAS